MQVLLVCYPPSPMSEARLEGIWIKSGHRGPMESRTEGRLLVGSGLAEGVQRKGKRQVTILSIESWRAAEQELGVILDPGLRRANLLVSGLELMETRGLVLSLGECRILIRGETTPCRRMEEAHPGLREALLEGWRGGVYGEVVAGGRIQVGDAVSWDDES